MQKIISPSPHINSKNNTTDIMLDVILALIPAAVCGVCYFGFNALVLIFASVASAAASEYLWFTARKQTPHIRDLSAILTGLILALNLPPTLPVWMAVLGSAFAIIVVKQCFGGLGNNFANPAAAARVVLLLSFPKAMTSFIVPFTDTIASATPIAEIAENKFDIVKLLLGNHPGTIGETSALLLIAGGIYLIIRKVISPTIPLCFIGSAMIMALIIGVNPIATVLSGGIIFGAIFMATDYVTSPVTFLGKIIFGIGCGIFTMLIRCFGNMPEGVSYSILIMNILTPHIDSLTRKKPFGKTK